MNIPTPKQARDLLHDMHAAGFTHAQIATQLGATRPNGQPSSVYWAWLNGTVEPNPQARILIKMIRANIKN